MCNLEKPPQEMGVVVTVMKPKTWSQSEGQVTLGLSTPRLWGPGFLACRVEPGLVHGLVSPGKMPGSHL